MRDHFSTDTPQYAARRCGAGRDASQPTTSVWSIPDSVPGNWRM